MIHNIRKIIQKTGFDFHKYRPQTDYWEYVKTLEIKTVLDIGANVGQFAKEARGKLPEARIYSFEPLKESFNKLQSYFGVDKKFTGFNFALGEKTEQITMHKSQYTPSSSLLLMSETHKTLFPHTKNHTEEDVAVKKLDEIAPQLNLEKELLIKIDVQGFEDKVINGGVETFKKAKVVLVETSFTILYEGQPTFDDIYEKLKSLGFIYKGSLQDRKSTRLNSSH